MARGCTFSSSAIGKQDTFHYDLQKLMDVDAKGSTMSEADFSVMGLGPLDAIRRRRLSDITVKIQDKCVWIKCWT